jgi:hypothetical protein
MKIRQDVFPEENEDVRFGGWMEWTRRAHSMMETKETGRMRIPRCTELLN